MPVLSNQAGNARVPPIGPEPPALGPAATIEAASTRERSLVMLAGLNLSFFIFYKYNYIIIYRYS